MKEQFQPADEILEYCVSIGGAGDDGGTGYLLRRDNLKLDVYRKN